MLLEISLVFENIRQSLSLSLSLYIYIYICTRVILVYRCTSWMLPKHMEKKLDGNYIRMVRTVFNKYWRQHPTKQQLYGHQPPITKTIQIRRSRHAGHCWRSKDELINDVLWWIPSHGRVKVGRPARTYLQQLCADTGWSLEELGGAWRNDGQ